MKKYIGLSGALLTFSFVALALPQEKQVPESALSGVVDDPGPSFCTDIPGNLVTNCGFETGSYSGWTQIGDMRFTDVVPTAANSGSFGARLGPDLGYGGIQQNITTVAGQNYGLTFYVRHLGGSPNGWRVSWNGTVIYSVTEAPDFMYTVYGFTVTATGTSSQIKFEFFEPPSYYYLDDVIVVPCGAE
jgi:flagellin